MSQKYKKKIYDKPNQSGTDDNLALDLNSIFKTRNRYRNKRDNPMNYGEIIEKKSTIIKTNL